MSLKFNLNMHLWAYGIVITDFFALNLFNLFLVEEFIWIPYLDMINAQLIQYIMKILHFV